MIPTGVCANLIYEESPVGLEYPPFGGVTLRAGVDVDATVRVYVDEVSITNHVAVLPFLYPNVTGAEWAMVGETVPRAGGILESVKGAFVLTIDDYREFLAILFHGLAFL